MTPEYMLVAVVAVLLIVAIWGLAVLIEDGRQGGILAWWVKQCEQRSWVAPLLAFVFLWLVLFVALAIADARD